jgi:hypothetical protein
MLSYVLAQIPYLSYSSITKTGQELLQGSLEHMIRLMCIQAFKKKLYVTLDSYSSTS